MKRPSSRRDRGFTLIEVLLVLVILVVLASLAVMAYGPIRAKALENSARVQVDLFNTAIEAFQLDVGSYPSDQTGLQGLRTPPGDIPDASKWNGPYLSKDISPDPWGHPYTYTQHGTHNPSGFDVGTVTPDGKEIGNWSETNK